MTVANLRVTHSFSRTKLMVERAILTQRIVDEAEGSISGERWISDTRQRGFGLRIWRSKSGETRKSFCIRAVDQEGRAVRLTMDYWPAWAEFRERHWWEYRQGQKADPTLGELIDYARRWAHDELAKLRGTATLEEEETAQRDIGKRRAAVLTFRQTADIILRGMASKGLSEAYTDRLEKLFSNHVPATVAAKLTREVSRDDVACILNSSRLTPGNLRILRPFIRQALDVPWRFRTESKVAPHEIDEIVEPIDGQQLAALRTWNTSDYEAIFLLLETEPEKWQQARCLRIYFLSHHCPLSKLMAARWDQVWTTKRGGRSKVRWIYSDRRSGWASFPSKGEQVLRECLELGQAEFGDSEFCFPTRFGRKVGHIRSIEHIWRQTLFSRGLRYVSPRAFRKAYRATLPWDGWIEEIATALSISGGIPSQAPPETPEK